MKRNKLAAAAAITVVISSLGLTSAAATGGSGNTSTADSVSGALDGTSRPLRVSQDGVNLITTGPTTVTTFDLTYPSKSFSGWHSHPGIVIVVVKSGSVVRQTGCRSEKFEVGDSFTEVGSHYVSNPGSVAAVLSITRIYPTSQAGTPRIDEPAPRCS